MTNKDQACVWVVEVRAEDAWEPWEYNTWLSLEMCTLSANDLARRHTECKFRAAKYVREEPEG